MTCSPTPGPIFPAPQQGLTLVELLTTIALLAILLSLAVPGLQDLIRNASLTGRANEMLAVLLQARQQSVNERLPVVVAASNGNWAAELQVFVDRDGDGALGANESVLAEVSAAPGSIHALLEGGMAIHFDATGALADAQPQLLLLCGSGWAPDKDDRYARTLVIHGAGRAEIVRGSDLFGGCNGLLP